MVEFDSIADLLRSGPLPAKFELVGNSCSSQAFVMRNRLVYVSRDDAPVAILLSLKGRRRGFLMNADGLYNEFVSSVDRNDTKETWMPSVSFSCLARLLFPKLEPGVLCPASKIVAVAKKIAAGNITVLDYEPDSYISMTFQERNQKEPHPPQPGYTQVDELWHRPATVLFRSGGICYLVGQDEDQYFGVQLRGRDVKTIREAFLDLQPESVRGKKWKRQGEWFVVQIAEKDIPNTHSTIEAGGNVSINLQKTDPKSNDHTVTAAQFLFGLDGTIYAKNFLMEHDQHAPLEEGGWWSIARNTAVRSVSEDGVD